eukprot:TRINITY_DN12031_c0_g1_i1.p1 TRINITY_DN12031_c0_g1~~TRINITY_DN12031_c0_g1_i1.p1  ORF type:complete len:106 (+),score=22.85 TRINITY_DN12031_c0_g1_i1:105-422(+)
MNGDFYRIYGIMNESSVVGKIQISEIYRIFTALNIMEYYECFLSSLSPHEKPSMILKVDITQVFAVLNSSAFLLSLPLRASNHPTYINILLLKSVLIVYMKHLLS